MSNERPFDDGVPIDLVVLPAFASLDFNLSLELFPKLFDLYVRLLLAIFWCRGVHVDDHLFGQLELVLTGLTDGPVGVTEENARADVGFFQVIRKSSLLHILQVHESAASRCFPTFVQ